MQKVGPGQMSYIDPAILRYLYFERNLSARTIGNILDITRVWVHGKFKEYGIKAKPAGVSDAHNPTTAEYMELVRQYRGSIQVIPRPKPEPKAKYLQRPKIKLEATRKNEYPDPSYAHCLAGGEVSGSYFDRLAAWEEGRRAD